MPKTGGTVTTVLPGVEAGALAVDATNLYWSASDGLHETPFAGDRLIAGESRRSRNTNRGPR